MNNKKKAKEKLHLILKSAITIIIFFTTINLYAQNINIKNGAYENIKDFHKNKPYIENTRFTFKHFLQKDIYKVSAKNKRGVSKRKLKKALLIFQDSALYINLRKIFKGFGFAKVLEFGRFSLFRGLIILAELRIEYQGPIIFRFWTLPKRIRKKVENELFIIDLKTGFVKEVSISAMYSIIKNDLDLLKKYKNEENKVSYEIIKKNLQQLNSGMELY